VAVRALGVNCPASSQAVPARAAIGRLAGTTKEQDMSAFLLTPPAAEPFSLAYAKDFLRVEHEADDELIAALIAAARGEIELATRRVLLTQTWRIVLHRWPAPRRVASPVNPLRTLVAVRVFDAEGGSIEANLAGAVLDTASVPGAIDLTNVALPAPGRAVAGIELDVTAGYGEAADVPTPLVQALRLLVARAYEHRDRLDADALPDAVAKLLAPFRVLSI
jgi:uncharacterized phiE125 gp8 family phage protein